ncbi:hypothetical protein D3C77_549250 [compost metagenome]
MIFNKIEVIFWSGYLNLSRCLPLTTQKINPLNVSDPIINEITFDEKSLIIIASMYFLLGKELQSFGL